MAGFYGIETHALDERGRLALPVKMREGLGERVWVMAGWEGSLLVFPAATWQAIEEGIQSDPTSVFDLETRRFNRLVYTGDWCDIDRQGRINVPSGLRGKAKLTDDVVITGAKTYIELWSPAAFEAEEKALDASGPTILNRITTRAGAFVHLAGREKPSTN